MRFSDRRRLRPRAAFASHSVGATIGLPDAMDLDDDAWARAIAPAETIEAIRAVLRWGVGQYNRGLRA